MEMEGMKKVEALISRHHSSYMICMAEILIQQLQLVLLNTISFVRYSWVSMEGDQMHQILLMSSEYLMQVLMRLEHLERWLV